MDETYSRSDFLKMASAVLIAPLLVACGGAGTKTASPPELVASVISPIDGDVLDAAVAAGLTIDAPPFTIAGLNKSDNFVRSVNSQPGIYFFTVNGAIEYNPNNTPDQAPSGTPYRSVTAVSVKQGDRIDFFRVF